MNPSERIYLASTSDGEQARLAAGRLARLIEDDIAAMALAPGVALGSLRELSARYRQGRSVVREAISLLERRGLGRMRPGPCGGFIVARPTAEMIGVELAGHLRAAGCGTRAVEDAAEALEFMRAWQTEETVAVVRLLAACLRSLDEAQAEGEPATGATARGRNPASLPALIARRLATEITRNGSAGARLGSEWDLCERFQVSRLTLRQTIRLLQDDGLVECRRGRGNGLVIRDRRGPASIRLALAYLIGERLDPKSAGTSLFQLNAYIPALAVSRADAAQRATLGAALSRLEGRESIERYDLLGLVHCVARLADSPIIDLFSRCLAAYEARFHPMLAERLPASAQSSYFRLVRQLLEGLPAGDRCALSRARADSAALMLDMSQRRPL